MSLSGWLDEGIPDGYERLYYFTPSDFVLENLLSQRVKLSRFSKCNDLFELASVNLGPAEIREKHKKWISTIEGKLGLLCLSSSWQHPLMWAHYAASGSGVCLVLDVFSSIVTEVEYLRERVKKEDFVFPQPKDPNFRQFCSTKAKFWNYENEARLFFNLKHDDIDIQGGNYFLKLGQDVMLAGIINGPRPRLGKRVLMSAFGSAVQDDPQNRFIQARAAYTRFEIVTDLVKSRWLQ